MELLKNKLIEKQLHDTNYFDLVTNNTRLNVISLTQNKSFDLLQNALKEDPLSTIFSDVLANRKIKLGYYQLRNIFIESQLYHPWAILHLIIKTTEDKVNSIADNIQTVKKITMLQYIQIWTEYKRFNHEMFYLLQHHQKFLTDQNISVSNRSNNILSILQICIFHDKIFSKNILDDIMAAEFVIDQQNIEQFITLIDAIRIFLLVQSFITVKKDKIIGSIKKILSDIHIINQLCLYTNHLLLKLNQRDFATDQTLNVKLIEKSIVRKIYKILGILVVYSDREKLFLTYSKFMQARIITTSYTNLELEIELVKRISGSIGKFDSQKLLSTITDIIYSRAFVESLHQKTIKISSTKYYGMDPIKPKVITPILLSSKNWKFLQQVPLPIVYPKEISYCLDVVSKLFSKIPTDDLDYHIEWNYLLGTAEFECNFKSKKIILKCNFMQAILLSYLNENELIIVDDFVKFTGMNVDLVKILLETLVEAGIVVNFDETYVPNVDTYYGELNVDLQKIFIAAFNTDTTDNVKSKFTYELSED